ncbi:MAG: amidase [Candidatus Helarchaeota archaeon]|nr:amidase [Candidatus Helarchaeota archaeon]
MKKEDICYMSASDMAESIKKQELTSEEITETIIERIEKINPMINAYCTTTFDKAREMAKKADDAVKKGKDLGLLTGIPTSIKDLASIKGVRTTFGSKLFENYIPEENSSFVNKLIDAGCVILGKTNTPEFGFKGVTDNFVFGASRNPWNLERTTGGSSGGAAAAVASGMSPLAQGSDGGGSIRIPSSLCGCYGLKPSLGRVAIYPRLHTFAQTLTVVGPIVRHVKDAALMLDVMKGPHEGDRLSLPLDNVNYLEAIEIKPKKMRIGYSLKLGFAKVVDQEVEKAFLNAIQLFEKLGWTIEESKIKLKRPESPFYTLWTTQIGHFLNPKLKEWRDKIDPELVKLVDIGVTYNGLAITKAMNDRRKLCDTLYTFFKDFDVLVTPTTAVPAFKLGMMYPPTINGRSVSPTGWQPFSFPFNLTGHPAATIPYGWSSEGLPIGLQIVGKRFAEATVLQVSKAFEEVAPWQDKKPEFD